MRNVRSHKSGHTPEPTEINVVNVVPLGVARYFTAKSARISAHERHNSDQFPPCPVQRTREHHEEVVSFDQDGSRYRLHELTAAMRRNWRTILLLSFLMLIGMVGAYIDLHLPE